MDASATCTKGKSISTFIFWPQDVREAFLFKKNDSETKVINAVCKMCKKHADQIVKTCHGRIADDVKKYGQTGTSHLLLPNLKRHIASKCHVRALELECEPKIPKNQSTLDQSFKVGSQSAIDQCTKLMNIAWYIAENERPFTAFPKLCSLMTENGVVLSGSYTDDQAAKAFIHLLAGEIVNEVTSFTQKSHFVSFLVDGSTVMKKKISYEGELLYVRTAYELSVKVELCDFISMKKYVSVTADNLTHAVTTRLLCLLGDDPSCWKTCEHDGLCECQPVQMEDIPIDKLNTALEKFQHKLIGGSADGAAVNFGCRKGLMTQMKNKIPSFVAIHCLSHRLELAISDALKNTKFSDVNEFLDTVYLHFRNSPKEWTGVLATADMMECRATQPPRSTGTRFVSFRLRALEALINNWAILINFFSYQASSVDKNDNSEKARGFLRTLLDGQFLCRCWTYKDILLVASKTCCLIQDSKTMSIAHALTELRTMKVTMEELWDNGGDNEEAILDKLRRAPLTKDPVHPTPVTRTANQTSGGDSHQKEVFLSVKKLERVRKSTNTGESTTTGPSANRTCKEQVLVNHSNTIFQSIPAERAEAVSQLLKATQNRFEEFDNNDNVLSHLLWIHVSSWPICTNRKPSAEEVKHIREFQNEDVSEIIDHYTEPLFSASPNFSKQKALKQFQDLKLKWALSPALQEMTPDSYWPYIFKSGSSKKDLFLVVELVLSLPFSEAVVERGFSAKGRIVSDWRSSLSHATITDLLHFSCRKRDFQSTQKQKLVNQASGNFVRGMDGKAPGSGLSKRRIRKLCHAISDKDEVSRNEGPVASSSDSQNYTLSEGADVAGEASDSPASTSDDDHIIQSATPKHIQFE